MAPSMSLCRATGRPAAGLTSSRRRSTTRRSVAAHATSDDRPNAALLALSAGALLAQSAAVDPAAAAQLAPTPDQTVLSATHISTSQGNKFSATTAPTVRADESNITRTSSGPEANMNDPDAYFDQASVPVPVLGELADLNADVRDTSKNYRDPAGAIQQDKFAGKVKSGPSLGTPNLGKSIKSGLKQAQQKVSALPTPAVGDLADLNADVRDDATNYRDPVIAVPQDKVTDAATNKPASSALNTPDVPTVGQAADAAKKNLGLDKGSKMFSALPTPAVGDLADLNADVRDASKNYRDPAGAIQQDKFADKVKSGPSLGSSDLGDSVKSGLKDVQKKASKAVSALPTPAVGDLADLNADVRDASKNYRDPAGAVQQDKFAGKVKSGPSLGTPNLGKSIKSGLKQAQQKVSALPTPAVGDLADLNADVRGDAADYRDPAGAVQQDTAADAVKSNLSGLSASKATTPSAKKYGKKVLSNVTQTKREIGVKAGYGPSGTRVRDSTGKLINADDVRGTNPAIGNARLSQPLVRDSVGVKRVSSKNQTGAAGGSDRQGVVKPLKEVVDRVAN